MYKPMYNPNPSHLVKLLRPNESSTSIEKANRIFRLELKRLNHPLTKRRYNTSRS